MLKDKDLEFLGMLATVSSVLCFALRHMQSGYALGVIAGLLWALWGLRGAKAGGSFMVLQGFLIAINLYAFFS